MSYHPDPRPSILPVIAFGLLLLVIVWRYC